MTALSHALHAESACVLADLLEITIGSKLVVCVFGGGGGGGGGRGRRVQKARRVWVGTTHAHSYR